MMMTQVCSGLGDLQCSVRATLGFDNKDSKFTDAVINVSTSAQVGLLSIFISYLVKKCPLTSSYVKNLS